MASSMIQTPLDKMKTHALVENLTKESPLDTGRTGDAGGADRTDHTDHAERNHIGRFFQQNQSFKHVRVSVPSVLP
jgi:hypothetical protein